MTGNYGWDIIILTIIIRVILLPLTLSSVKGMKGMQIAQPRVKELQEKYKDDREKLNREMMLLYKEIGFNPLASCLPMFLQLPIFIALYRVLAAPELNGYLFANQAFYGMNLTAATFNRLSPDFLRDVSLVLPGMVDLSRIGFSYFQNTYLYITAIPVVVLMTVTTIVQQMMMTVDPQQKPTMWIMNIFLTVIAFTMPTGVLLYWGVSNALQFVQQAFTKAPETSKKTSKKTSKNTKDSQTAAKPKAEQTTAPQAKSAGTAKKQPQKPATQKPGQQKPTTPKTGAPTTKTYPGSKGGGSKKKKKK